MSPFSESIKRPAESEAGPHRLDLVRLNRSGRGVDRRTGNPVGERPHGIPRWGRIVDCGCVRGCDRRRIVDGVARRQDKSVERVDDGGFGRAVRRHCCFQTTIGVVAEGGCVGHCPQSGIINDRLRSQTCGVVDRSRTIAELIFRFNQRAIGCVVELCVSKILEEVPIRVLVVDRVRAGFEHEARTDR